MGAIGSTYCCTRPRSPVDPIARDVGVCGATVPVLGLAEPRFAEPRAAERSDDARQDGDGRHFVFFNFHRCTQRRRRWPLRLRP